MSDNALERAALVALLFPPQPFKWAGLRDQVVEGELSPSSVLKERAGSGSFDSYSAELDRAHARIEKWESSDTKFISYLDPEFPLQLRDAHDFPPFIFARGRLSGVGRRERGVSVVGSRKVSDRAANTADKIARGLIDSDIAVISGLAMGVDSIAHSAALELHGRTVGVIGTGIDKYYPRSSEPLQRMMEDGAGLVISQFWPGAAPTRASFPMRNTVMSAYSRATIIVEAEEKSGTRHQAHRAVRHGRPLILMRSVVESTSWGQHLSSDPARFDVHVANDAEHAVELAVSVSQELRALDPAMVRGASIW